VAARDTRDGCQWSRPHRLTAAVGPLGTLPLPRTSGRQNAIDGRS
jgi:hypothetical protein